MTARLGLAALVVLLVAAAASCGGDPQRTAAATTTAHHLALVRVGTFSGPVYATSPPADKRRLFVVERAGVIRVVRGGKTLDQPFLDIHGLVTSSYAEQGLLSVAFAPDYASSGRFYVYYTDRDQQQRVVEYRRATADSADPASARLVLKMADTEANHNGGLLMFGPDGLLYIGTGDGGGANDVHGLRGNAQNLGSLLGKILRIDPRQAGGQPYSVPSSNPFAGRAGARGEIYSYGLRNPWRFSFDRLRGDLAIADVGQDAVEEVDFARKDKASGMNFGWRPFEGTRRNYPGESAPGAVAPVIEKLHSDGWCSITGGYVVRDPELTLLKGQYIYGDFCQGKLRAAKLFTGYAKADRELPLKTIQQLSSFGQDASGRVYVASLAGPVYRLTQR